MPEDLQQPQPILLSIIRFPEELIAFGGLFWWGWSIVDGGVSGIALGGLFFVVGAALWGTFAVPNDLARNPDPPIGVPGWLRLVIEIGVLGVAAYGIWVSGARWLSETLLTLSGVYYLLSYERTMWLLKQRDFRGPGKKATS